MQYLMQSTLNVKKMRLMILLIILPTAVMSCTATNPLPTYPANLNVIKLNDGGVCFDKESAIRLSEFKADLEAY